MFAMFPLFLELPIPCIPTYDGGLLRVGLGDLAGIRAGILIKYQHDFEKNILPFSSAAPTSTAGYWAGEEAMREN